MSSTTATCACGKAHKPGTVLTAKNCSAIRTNRRTGTQTTPTSTAASTIPVRRGRPVDDSSIPPNMESYYNERISSLSYAVNRLEESSGEKENLRLEYGKRVLNTLRERPSASSFRERAERIRSEIQEGGDSDDAPKYRAAEAEYYESMADDINRYRRAASRLADESRKPQKVSELKRAIPGSRLVITSHSGGTRLIDQPGEVISTNSVGFTIRRPGLGDSTCLWPTAENFEPTENGFKITGDGAHMEYRFIL